MFSERQSRTSSSIITAIPRFIVNEIKKLYCPLRSYSAELVFIRFCRKSCLGAGNYTRDDRCVKILKIQDSNRTTDLKWQISNTTRSSADPLEPHDAPQIRNIALENFCKWGITFKDTQGHYNRCY